VPFPYDISIKTTNIRKNVLCKRENYLNSKSTTQVPDIQHNKNSFPIKWTIITKKTEEMDHCRYFEIYLQTKIAL
jgi:hypothetical protein